MHLLFDLDGTLADSRVGILRCFQYALRELGAAMPTEPVLARYIGSTLPIGDCLAELLGTTDALLVERAIAVYRSRFEPVGMFESTLYDGVEAALASLSATGHGLHVVTAKPSAYARQIIRHFEIDCYFRSITGPDLSERRFTKGTLIRRALLANRSAPADAVVIGDRAADIQGAQENGVRSIAVTWGYGEPEELREADHVVDSWTALVACLHRGAEARSTAHTPGGARNQ